MTNEEFSDNRSAGATQMSQNDNRRDENTDPDRYRPQAERFIGPLRRNPEAFLVLAAGVALLLRGGGNLPWRSRSGETYGDDEGRGGAVRAAREGLSDAAETVSEYASEVKDRIYETASSYASSATSYAHDSRRRLGRRASRLSGSASRLTGEARSAAGEMLHERPLAVAALGLAAGAGVAALLPRMEIEEQALRPAREALADAANRAAETVKDAAEHALTPKGMTDLALGAASVISKGTSGGNEAGRRSSGRATASSDSTEATGIGESPTRGSRPGASRVKEG